MPDSQNPFAAPKHDSPPVDKSPQSRPLKVLGIMEMAGGVGLGLLAIRAIVATASGPSLPLDEVPHYAFYAGSVVTLAFGVLCIVAGRSLFRGRRTWWLQFGPTLVAIYLLGSMFI